MSLTMEVGAVVYDHTFQVTTQSSTTSTTQIFFTHYSAPRIGVSPRRGVSLNVTVTASSQGLVWGEVQILNDSDSPFRFAEEDLQLYVNAGSVSR